MIVRRRDGNILRQLQTLYNIGSIGDLTDGQLLERFATDADEAAELAFSALVERHQAMVWRVCLAIVRDEHQAEDAFQATFLVLVRKARSLWVRDSLGPWLHQVACRTATCLRTTILRRRKHERLRAAKDVAQGVEVGPPRDPDRDAAIHEEVDRLPEKYRAALVLCDLEGRTHQEAARFLGWPIGTVKSRQSHGRGLIRERLARRGLGLAVAGAVVESLNRPAVAAIPKHVSRNAVAAVMRQSARLLTGAGVSTQALTVSQGVLRAMLWGQLRFLTAATLAVGVATGGAGLYVGGSQGSETKDGRPPSKQTNGDPESGPGVAGTRATLRAQRLATRKARASHEIAKQTRVLAEIAVEEYEEVDYPRDQAAVEGEIKLAEADLARAEDRTAWAARMCEKGYVSRAQLVSEELNLKKARFAVEQAQSKLIVLEEYSRAKTTKELKGAVEKARTDERIKEAAWDLEQAKENGLELQLRPE